MALTDQAIEKIKDLIVAGEFAPGSKLPKERELAERLGLSRNSLREAVRALTLIGVLEPRQGDGTYVTTLEPDLLLAGTMFVSDLLTGGTVLELHEVRRILETAATAMAATRLTDEELEALARTLDRMDAAETTQDFIDSDLEFHRIIVGACGNTTLASLIQNLSGGTLRARIWRAINERGAVDSTRELHHDIYRALVARDPNLAAAADLIHLADGERWLRGLLDQESRAAAGAFGGAGS
jgi:DNA-binding FadR family transcriptional regulator